MFVVHLSKCISILGMEIDFNDIQLENCLITNKLEKYSCNEIGKIMWKKIRKPRLNFLNKQCETYVIYWTRNKGKKRMIKNVLCYDKEYKYKIR